MRADEREGKQEKARMEGREESEGERKRKKRERARKKKGQSEGERERARTRAVEIVYMRWERNANGK